MIVNLQDKQSLKIDKMCSQIDLYPTLFNFLGWKYTSNLYGKNVISDNYIPRIFVGTYQNLPIWRMMISSSFTPTKS
jgi:hypothetical protein